MKDLDKKCLLTYTQKLKIKEVFDKIVDVLLIVGVIWLFICLLVIATGGTIAIIKEGFL